MQTENSSTILVNVLNVAGTLKRETKIGKNLIVVIADRDCIGLIDTKGEKMDKYYKFNDGFFAYYVNVLTGEKKFKLTEGDIEVEPNLDDFSRAREKGEPNE